MLTFGSIKDLSSFLYLVKLMSADYDKLLFYEQYLTMLTNLFILFVW
jgi:hypothetical protein